MEWIPVSERLPDVEGRYLIIYKTEHYRRAFIGDYLPQEGVWTSISQSVVTHWCEIPEFPPEEQL